MNVESFRDLSYADKTRYARSTRDADVQKYIANVESKSLRIILARNDWLDGDVQRMLEEEDPELHVRAEAARWRARRYAHDRTPAIRALTDALRGVELPEPAQLALQRLRQTFPDRLA